MKRLIKSLLLAIGFVASATHADGNIFSFRHVAWDGSRYLLASESGLLTSVDAKTWKRLPNPAVRGEILGLATNGKVSVAIGWDKTPLLITGDSVTTAPVINFYDAYLSFMVWTGKEFIGVGPGDSGIRSTDGKNWSSVPSNAKINGWHDKIVVGDSTLMMVRSGGLFRSTDGFEWTIIPMRSTVNDIFWSGKEFMVAGDQGLVASSQTGLTWSEDTVARENFASYGNFDKSYNGAFGIASTANGLIMLDVFGIHSMGDFGKWSTLSERGSDDFWSFPWVIAGSRIFNISQGVIWSTTNGKDTLFGVVDTSSKFQAPHTLGIRNRTLQQPKFDASGLHLEFAQPTDVKIDLYDTRGRLQANIARGYLEAGSHVFAIPHSGTAFLRIQSNRETTVIPMGIAR